MEQNLISAEIAVEDIAQINSAIDLIKQKLPFLITFTDDQKKEIHKLGNVLKPFVDDAADAAIRYPQIMSGTFNQQEYKRDYQLYKTLTEIDGKLASLHSAVNDTLIAAGSDVLGGSLEIYSSVLANQKKVPGLDTVAAKLRVFFEKKKGGTKPPPQA